MAIKNPNSPHEGVNLAAARKELAGLPKRPLDTDWLAIDRDGRVALFVGNERGPIPEPADVTLVVEALEALARAATVRKASAVATETSRGSASLAADFFRCVR